MYGKIIKELRKEKGLTQTELAKKLNTTQKNISKYELEFLDLNTEIAIAIADYFDVSVDYLLGREDDFGVVKRESPADKDGEELLSLYRELTPSAQEAIKETIRQLVARQNGATDTGEIK